MKKIKKVVNKGFLHTKDVLWNKNLGFKKKILWIGNSYMKDNIFKLLENRWILFDLEMSNINNLNINLDFENNKNKLSLDKVSNDNLNILVDNFKKEKTKIDTIFIQNFKNNCNSFNDIIEINKLNLFSLKLASKVLQNNGTIILCGSKDLFDFNSDSNDYFKIINNNFLVNLGFHLQELDFWDYENTIFNLLLDDHGDTDINMNVKYITKWIDGKKKPFNGSFVYLDKNNNLELI